MKLIDAPRPEHEPDGRKIIEADEIRVGPLVITKTPDGGAGVWIGGQYGTPIACLFHVKGDGAQTGVGVYASAAEHACNACLTADHKEGGSLQLCRGDEVEFLALDDLKKIKQLP